MRIEQQTIGLTVDDSLMRVHLARPVEEGPWPGLIFYSDIYQLGDPILRLANRLAGYGFVVAAPEIFHRVEPVGTVIEPDAIGRLRGNDAARRTEIASYDADAKAVLTWLSEQTEVDEQPVFIQPGCRTENSAAALRIRCNGPARSRGLCSRCSAPKTPMCRLRIVTGFSRPCRG